MKVKVLDRFVTSSKWQAGGLAGVLALMQPQLQEWGMSADQCQGLFYSLLACVGAQAASDFGKEAKAK